MLRRIVMVAVTISLTLLTLAGSSRAELKQVPVARIHAQLLVDAAPAAVWTTLTTGKNLVTWCPVWKNAANVKVTITKVGDVLDFTDRWGNGGRSVVTYLARNKEIRVAHEPNDGSYMCQAKITLEPSGAGTTVHYTEQYTDESATKNFEATAQKMQSDMDQTLASLKRSAEKK